MYGLRELRYYGANARSELARSAVVARRYVRPTRKIAYRAKIDESSKGSTALVCLTARLFARLPSAYRRTNAAPCNVRSTGGVPIRNGCDLYL